MLKTLFKSSHRAKETRRTAARLIAELTVQARRPEFFTTLGVADTMDGRFDMVALHAWLVLDRLAVLGRRELAQAVTNRLFIDFDEALREQGAGDMGMSRRMTKMGDAFYGRLQAYGSANGESELAEAVRRNVFRGADDRAEQSHALARYIENARAAVAQSDPGVNPLNFPAVLPR